MKSVWYEQQGGPEVLQFGEMPKPIPASGEVLVRVHTSGVNPSDVKIRAGLRGAMPFPRQTPHSDGAGVITAVGDEIDRMRLGERVWLWNAAIGRANGSCADYITLPANQTVTLHPATSFHAGACFGVPLMTATYGVFADGAVDGKTVLVSGGGGTVGGYAVQMAHLGGARVIATAGNATSAATAKNAGADEVIYYQEEDVAARVATLTDGDGVDRVIEVEFGGNLAVNEKILRRGGMIAAYGSMATPQPILPFYALMFNNITVRMFLIYTIDETARRQVIELIRQHEPVLSHSVTKILPLSETAQAHALVEAEDWRGKVVIETEHAG